MDDLYSRCVMDEYLLNGLMTVDRKCKEEKGCGNR